MIFNYLFLSTSFLFFLTACYYVDPEQERNQIVEESLNRHDYETAYHLFLTEAEKGNALAQYNIGTFYYQGLGVKQNYFLAKDWFEKSAAQNNVLAQKALGVMYSKGEGVLQDYDHAQTYLLQAAEQDDQEAQELLGEFYLEHGGNPAFIWLNKAANNNNPIAQYYVGVMFETGNGIPMDKVAARHWYEQAAKQNEPRAQKALQHFEAL